MNFKQKLVYMLFGCLFTLAGYVLASLGGGVLQSTHAQQNENEVIDEIVCKKIKVVNDFGDTMAVIEGSIIGPGTIYLHNIDGMPVVELGSYIVQGTGYIYVNNKEGKRLVSVSATKGRPNDGLINVYNHKGEWRSISKD